MSHNFRIRADANGLRRIACFVSGAIGVWFGAPANDAFGKHGAREGSIYCSLKLKISAARSNPRRPNFRPFHFGDAFVWARMPMLMTSVRAWRSTAAKSFGANASAWIVYQASLGALARAALVGHVAIRIDFHETTFKTIEHLMLGAHQDAAKLDDAGVT